MIKIAILGWAYCATPLRSYKCDNGLFLAAVCDQIKEISEKTGENILSPHLKV